MAVSAQLGLCKLVALVVKKLPEPTCQCRRHKRHRFDPQVGKFPQSRWDNPLQHSCLEKSVDRGTWRATVPGGTESRTWLSDLARTGRTQQDNCQHADGRERPLSYRQEPAVSWRPFIRKIISPEVASPAEEGVGSQRNENKSWRVMAPGRSWTRCWGKWGHWTQTSSEQLGPSHAPRLKSWTWPTPRSLLSIRRPKLIWKLLTFLSNCKLIWPRANDCQRWSHCAEFSLLAQILQLKEISEI